MLPQKRKNI